MKGKIYNIIFLGLVIVASIVSIFIFNLEDSYRVVGDGYYVYLTAKITAIAFICLIILLLVLKKYNNSIPIIMSFFAVVYQFLPLCIRFLAIGENVNLVTPWIIYLIVTVFFAGLVLSFDYIASKD